MLSSSSSSSPSFPFVCVCVCVCVRLYACVIDISTCQSKVCEGTFSTEGVSAGYKVDDRYGGYAHTAAAGKFFSTFELQLQIKMCS